MGHPKGRDNDSPQYTDHCFTGDYHNLIDEHGEQDFKQLSLLTVYYTRTIVKKSWPRPLTLLLVLIWKW